MELLLDCIPCMIRQSLDGARMATSDEDLQKEVIDRAMEKVKEYKNYRNAPDLVRDIHKIVKDVTGDIDPYRDIKNSDLKAASELYPWLKEFNNEKEDKVYWGLKTAATGNNIDAAVYKNIDVEEIVKKELEIDFTHNDIDILREKLKSAKKILVIGDNTGETVFDKVMMENIPGIEYIYGVRSEPIINDTTENEAKASGINDVAKIISTGCSAPGAILEDCNSEFKKHFKTADIIISKGQGNYEALSEVSGNLFFVLKAKCPAIAEKLGVKTGSYILKFNK